jgi:ribosomal protein L3 glutamine methyltransferase
MAHLGGEDGLDLVRRILAEATDHLNPGGGLLCEIGTGRERLVDDYPQLDFLWLDTEESEGEVFWITREQLLEAGIA